MSNFFVALGFLQSHAVARSSRAPFLRMNNQWLRAFRSVAQTPRQSRLLSLPTRHFCSTAPDRAPNHGGSTPPDDGQKPENEKPKDANGEAQEPEENLLGDNTPVATNGETRDWKRSSNSWKSRSSRSRRSKLPPVHLPKPFKNLALYRHDETRKANTWIKEHADEEVSASTVGSLVPPMDLSHLFNTVVWSDRTRLEAAEILSSGGDIGPLIRRMDLFGALAYLCVVHKTRQAVGEEAHLEFLAEGLPQKFPAWVSKLLSEYTGRTRNFSEATGSAYIVPIIRQVLKDGETPLTKVAFHEPDILDEITTAVRAELLIRAPQNTRLAIFHRPTTIVNLPECSAFSVARDALQHVAGEVGADVMHLRAHDLAYIVGRHAGQDVTRTPGAISLLGYKAAENSGRLRRSLGKDDSEEPGGPEATVTFLLQNGKQRKDPGRQMMSMSDFLSSSGTRGKNEELWEYLKVKSALEELINSADADATEQKPLIIHIHDYNALNMDDAGASVVSKIRQVVDELWLSGRDVALVGTCSTRDSPKAYLNALEDLEATERVIHLRSRYSDKYNRESSYDVARTNADAAMQVWMERDNRRENVENLVRMLCSMTETKNSISAHLESTLGLFEDNQNKRHLFPDHWNMVLPMLEIYRTATTMIGSNTGGTDELFARDCFEKAVAKMAAVDAFNKKQEAQGMEEEAATKNVTSHEEKLLSGLINAKDMRTTFKDIHAPQETIESIKMLTTLSLIRPEAFSYGVLASDRIPGCLLYGPPGTGKTLLAKAVAKESGANMVEVSAANINNMYIGESEKTVQALFSLAKKKQPMVIFIDEADALLGARRGIGRQGDYKRETINQFLREWDGMDATKAFIMVATNRPFDLDEAVLRRLPRKLLIDLPIEADRAAILKIHLRDELVDETMTVEEIAKRTPLYSGSDLKNVCVAAAMAAVKEELDASEKHTGPGPYQWAEKRVLSRRHFEKALLEIGASSSEDMATLTAIRKFDERYGDNRARKKKKKSMGFEVVPEAQDSDSVRVRSSNSSSSSG